MTLKVKFELKTYFIDPRTYCPNTLLDYVTKNLSAKTNFGFLDTFFLPDENSIDLKINKKIKGYRLSGRTMDSKDFLRVGWKDFKNFVYPVMRINLLVNPNEDFFNLEAKIETNFKYRSFVNDKARYLIRLLAEYGCYK